MEGSTGLFYVCSLCGVGILISVYAIYVEYMSHSNPDYVAMCDISEEISCSKVLSGEYGKMLSKFGLVKEDSLLDISNAVIGTLLLSSSQLT